MALICSRPSHYFSFKAMMLLTMLLFVLKIIVGKVSNSMALLADSFHMVSDMAALVVGYFALRYSRLDGHDAKFSFGLARAEVLGALVNAIFLTAVCFGVTVESLKRLVEPETVHEPYPVLAVGSVGVVFNALGLVLFRWTTEKHACQRDSDADDVKAAKVEQVTTTRQRLLNKSTENTAEGEEPDKAVAVGHAKWAHEVSVPHELNVRTIHLHCFSHVLSALIVILSASLTILIHRDWVAYLDPVLSLFVIAIILRSCYPLLKEPISLFMQSVPAGLKVKHLRERIHRLVPSVIDIHEMHVWQLAGHQVVGSAHVVFNNADEYKAARMPLLLLFKEEGIDSVTLQPEFKDVKEPNLLDGSCLLGCTKTEGCREKTCCALPSANHEHGVIHLPSDTCVTVDRETCI